MLCIPRLVFVAYKPCTHQTTTVTIISSLFQPDRQVLKHFKLNITSPSTTSSKWQIVPMSLKNLKCKSAYFAFRYVLPNKLHTNVWFVRRFNREVHLRSQTLTDSDCQAYYLLDWSALYGFFCQINVFAVTSLKKIFEEIAVHVYWSKQVFYDSF